MVKMTHFCDARPTFLRWLVCRGIFVLDNLIHTVEKGRDFIGSYCLNV